MLDKILSALDLTKEEVETYLALIETGPIHVGALAQRISKARPSLYGFLKRLQEKGIVVESSRGGVRTYAAQPPEKISQLFEERIAEIERAQKEYQSFIPKLVASKSASLSPKFQLFEGEQGVRHVLKDMLLYRNIETQAFWPIKSMMEALSPEFFESLNKERIKRNIHTRALWPETQKVDIKQHPYLGSGKEFKREIRIAPKEVDISMGYWIYQDKVACVSSKRESFGFIIESKEFVEMQRAQFETLWKLSKVLETDEVESATFLQGL